MNDMVKELQASFAEEATEIFDALDNTLLASEQVGEISDMDMANLFRAMHTLKGSGSSVELMYLAKFAHVTEDFMDKLRNGEIYFNVSMIPLLINCSDVLKDILDKELYGEIDDNIFKDMTSDLETSILACIKKEDASLKDETHNSYYNDNNDFGFFNKEAQDGKAKLLAEPSSEVKKALEVFHVIPHKKQENTTPKKSENKKTKQITQNTIRVNLNKIDLLMNSVGELVITNAMLAQHTSSIKEQEVRDAIDERLGALSRHIREMQESIMSIRMIPMENVYSKFPKLIRDNAKKLGKEVEFEHYGDAVEIDKAMIEGLMDPLIHIIRNSLDHGIEFPDERIKNNKNTIGKITISAEQENGQIIVKTKDNGRGIDIEALVEKAISNGIITETKAYNMDKKDKHNLIFEAGLSTSKTITDISGRGVGMDVAKSKVQP